MLQTMQWGLQILGGALALALWLGTYYQFHHEPALFVLKCLIAAVVVAVPVAIFGRVRHERARPLRALMAGALVGGIGQWWLYSHLPELGTGDPIGPIEGIKEIGWDLSFQGTPGTLYGAIVIVGGVAAALVRLIGPRGGSPEQEPSGERHEPEDREQ